LERAGRLRLRAAMLGRRQGARGWSFSRPPAINTEESQERTLDSLGEAAGPVMRGEATEPVAQARDRAKSRNQAIGDSMTRPETVRRKPQLEDVEMLMLR